VQAAALYPTLDFYGSVAGNGITLSKTYGIVPSQATVVPNGDPSTGLVGANTGSVQFPASVNVTPATRIARNLRASYTIGFLVNWNYSGLGVPAMSNAQAARAQARIAKLQLNQQVLDVLEQVRKSYINSQLAERQIDVTAKEVASSAEQLRLARVRLANGVGTNLELVQSQRDWVTALVHKAEAIISFNVAQAQLLRDVGLISVDTLTSGRLLTLDSVRLK
jgi:outer membrane protein TolC